MLTVTTDKITVHYGSIVLEALIQNRHRLTLGVVPFFQIAILLVWLIYLENAEKIMTFGIVHRMILWMGVNPIVPTVAQVNIRCGSVLPDCNIARMTDVYWTVFLCVNCRSYSEREVSNAVFASATEHRQATSLCITCYTLTLYVSHFPVSFVCRAAWRINA